MSFIGESRVSSTSPWYLFVCLGEDDCQMLLQPVEKLAAKYQREFEKWYDIHESGEMTDRQADKMLLAEEKRNAAETLLKDLKGFLETKKKIRERKRQIIKGGDQ